MLANQFNSFLIVISCFNMSAESKFLLWPSCCSLPIARFPFGFALLKRQILQLCSSITKVSLRRDSASASYCLWRSSWVVQWFGSTCQGWSLGVASFKIHLRAVDFFVDHFFWKFYDFSVFYSFIGAAPSRASLYASSFAAVNSLRYFLSFVKFLTSSSCLLQVHRQELELLCLLRE